jgi:GntR family transcriptional regulator
LDIHLSAGEGVPFYLQIVRQVKYLVASGRLATGQEVLPIRRLAERLQVNPNTVARAYRELERDGIVVKRRTAGTFVSEAGSPLAHDERIRILTDRVDALLAEADQMDVPIKALSELLTKRATIISRAKQAAPKQHHNSINKEG